MAEPGVQSGCAIAMRPRSASMEGVASAAAAGLKSWVGAGGGVEGGGSEGGGEDGGGFEPEEDGGGVPTMVKTLFESSTATTVPEPFIASMRTFALEVFTSG